MQNQNNNYNRQGSNYYPQQGSGQPQYPNQNSNYQGPPGQPPYPQQNSQYGRPSPYGQQPPNQPPYGQQPPNQMSQPPYGQQPPNQPPYGQQPPNQMSQPPYGQQPPNQPPYGQQPPNQPPYGQQPPNQPPYGQQNSQYGQQPPYPQGNMPPYGQGGDPNATDIPQFKLIGRGNGIDEKEYHVITHAAANALNAKEDPLSNGIIKKIKQQLGGEWMVFASVEGLKGYDFSLSIVTGNDFLSFTIQNFRFQVCRLRD